MVSERFLLWSSFVKDALDKSFLVAKFFCFVHVTKTYLCDPVYAYGPSMLPTLNLTGNLLLADRISARLGKVGPGDIVYVRSPENPRKLVTKRVIGMEGDRVTYLVDPENSDKSRTLVVPKGHVWIEGDYVSRSHDSRKFGPVPYGLIEGKLFWRVWPPEDFGPLGPKASK